MIAAAKNQSHYRKIIHMDMDAYYASVEQMDYPELKGKPVAVGGSKERGVVAAASYEARKYGVYSAMPSSKAARLCPNLIFQKPRFDRYKTLSLQIRDIFHEYTDLVEPLSLDEAYLDVTEVKKGPPSATLIAKAIKSDIRDRVGLIASAGISYNKFLAKTASDVDKPDGLYAILPEEAEDFLAKLPIKKFHGIGKVTAEKLQHAGIFKGIELRKLTKDDLQLRFGKSGGHYYNICRGIDHRPVEPVRERKSLSAERTFEKDVMDYTELLRRSDDVMQEVIKRYFAQERRGKTLTLKVKYGDFRQITKSHTSDYFLEQPQQIEKEFDHLISKEIIQPEGIRLIGLGISNFKHKLEDTIQLRIDF